MGVFTLPCLALPPVLLGLAGLFISNTFTMPHPYEGLRALEIAEEYVEVATPFPVNFETHDVKLNDKLTRATRLFEGMLYGPEGVSVSRDGRLLFLLDRYGYLHIAELPDASYLGSTPPTLHTNVTYIGPGRPLGFHATAHNTLIVCDSVKGLVEVDLSDFVSYSAVRSDVRNVHKAPISVLANQAPDGSPINYANDLDVASSGVVYFSSSTERGVSLNAEGYYDTLRSYLLNALRGDATGRVFSYDPATRKVTLLVDKVWYANGVALSEDEKWVYFVETSAFRVRRYCLVTGVVETVIDRLPGYPDGISRTVKGTFWVSLVAPVSPVSLLMRYPSARLLLSFAVRFATYLVKPQAIVFEMTQEGTVLRSLGDPKGERVSSVSSSTQVGNRLYLGNLVGNFVSFVDLEE